MRVVRYFRDLQAWQSAMDLAVAAYGLAGQLPPTHRFELGSQIRRSASSIPSNIAEGHSQRGDRVFLRHVRIALGSLAELDTQVEIAIRSKLVDDSAARSSPNRPGANRKTSPRPPPNAQSKHCTGYRRGRLPRKRFERTDLARPRNMNPNVATLQPPAADSQPPTNKSHQKDAIIKYSPHGLPLETES